MLIKIKTRKIVFFENFLFKSLKIILLFQKSLNKIIPIMKGKISSAVGLVFTARANITDAKIRYLYLILLWSNEYNVNKIEFKVSGTNVVVIHYFFWDKVIHSPYVWLFIHICHFCLLNKLSFTEKGKHITLSVDSKPCGTSISLIRCMNGKYKPCLSN